MKSLFDDLSEESRDKVFKLWKSGLSYEGCRRWLEENYGVDCAWWHVRYMFEKMENQEVDTEETPEGLEQRIKSDKTIETLKAESAHYRKLYYTAIKQASAADRVVKVAKEVTTALAPVKISPPEYQRAPAHTPLTAVAPLTDTHIGEKVDAEQMGGLNQYDLEIFNKRLYGWTQKILELVTLRTYVNVPMLYVPMIGDMVSGDIHLELVKTNLDNAMNQMIRGANMIAQALLSLSTTFKAIHVPCVVGNHGRMTAKPPSKDKYVDWDYLLYQWVAAFCKEQKNITFSIPKSFLHVFEVEGKRVLMLHGDSIRSWQGVPYYGILRTASQLRQTLQYGQGLENDLAKLQKNKGSGEELLNVLSSYFDYIFLGHFHRHDELDIGTGKVFICGCMKGGDEYAFGRLHTISRPEQILTFWHPRIGYASKDIIYLDRFDESDKMFEDALPSVWIEA